MGESEELGKQRSHVLVWGVWGLWIPRHKVLEDEREGGTVDLEERERKKHNKKPKVQSCSPRQNQLSARYGYARVWPNSQSEASDYLPGVSACAIAFFFLFFCS